MHVNHPHLESVSVVIVNPNAGELLVDSVRTALEQTVQVIVVDNDSVDSSMEMLNVWFPNEPRLLLHSVGRNLGFAAGCNLGLGLSTESYALFLTPDCVLGEDSLNRMDQVLEASTDVGMVGGFLIDPDGSGQGGGRRATAVLLSLGCHFPEVEQPGAGRIVAQDPAAIAAALVDVAADRSKLAAVGLAGPRLASGRYTWEHVTDG